MTQSSLRRSEISIYPSSIIKAIKNQEEQPNDQASKQSSLVDEGLITYHTNAGITLGSEHHKMPTELSERGVKRMQVTKLQDLIIDSERIRRHQIRRGPAKEDLGNQ